jgi:pyruvate dehydrogenase E2 component (dihydrolipoamide acetyltransferase)
MAELVMPRLSDTMEEGTILRWLKHDGDEVRRGDELVEIETDKANMIYESDLDGTLQTVAAEGDTLAVGALIAHIGDSGAGASAAPGVGTAPSAAAGAEAGADGGVSADDRADEAAAAPHAAAAPEQTFVEAIAEVAGGGAATDVPPRDAPPRDAERVKASPLARRIARERGVDLAQLRGTGPDGRIVAEDVERSGGMPAAAAPAAAAAAPSGEVESRPLSNVRKTIARRLTQAWTVPAFQLTVNVDMTRANELVQGQRDLNPDVRITVTDVLTKVCAQALMRHRDMNVQFADDALLVFPSADVGIAVAAPQGLVVPVVHGAERLTIAQIATVRGDLVGRARDAKLRAEDLEGGTFTISNLGMYDIDQFIAVLNPPQASILAVGSTRDQVVPVDGELHVLPVMTMTLTCDHRAVDGATGAEFLRTITSFLEDPGLAL